MAKRKRSYGLRTKYRRSTRRKIRKKRRPKRRSSRRKAGRKRRNYAGTNLFKGGTLPNKTRTKLVYAQFVSVSAVQQITGKYTFRANSIFDPDLTGAGHQPKFRDQLALYYSKYRVLGCSIKVSDIVIGTAASTPAMRIGVVPSLRSDITPNYMGNMGRLIEDGVKTGKFQERDIGQSSLRRTVGGYVSMYRIMQKDDRELDFAMTADPGADFAVDWDVIFASVNNVVPDTALTMNVKLTYYVELTDPIVVGQS